MSWLDLSQGSRAMMASLLPEVCPAVPRDATLTTRVRLEGA